ncbi:signal recognition particle-docking protein FtsY [Ichthyobacterium seriolicida]|uniref:Signal recognition particle receptor FtsY n=1 Tax=Ichthyobacterium seriolicida TaxID=242600 RepID=A0A1J1EB96_9FLAO|nr:signal recognition particle-docking protein FtsY [Ichthyobacterium seriolicida]BAV94784.1 signal recognition particle receptor protein FtsY [Ichthyobacterium seriolicida]
MSFLKNVFTKDKKQTLDKGLQKSKTHILKQLARAVLGKSTIDSDVLDNLEEALISSDVGVETTLKIIDNIEKRVSVDKYSGTDELNAILKDEIGKFLVEDSLSENIESPHVIMVVGVNGVGKTTTIGKIAHKFKKNDKRVILGAVDTFRAAAIEQLTIWSERTGSDIVKQKMGSDPAAVAYDTLQSVVSKKADVVIIDTAGRLHNKVNLMNELAKIKSVIKKVIPNAPHEILLVLDGSTGQNAVEQAREFTKVIDINSIAITKLDGTVKGGVLIGISDEFKIPIKYIGVGEGIEDLQLFDKKEFIDSLL